MTINTHNRGLEAAEKAIIAAGYNPATAQHIAQIVLDAARAEGSVQKPRKLNLPSQEWLDRHVETDPDVDVEAGGITPPADEVGRALERLTFSIQQDHVVTYQNVCDLRVVCSHVSRLEGDLKLAVEALEKIARLRTELSGDFSRSSAQSDIAREALSSLRPSVSAPGGDVEESRQSGGAPTIELDLRRCTGCGTHAPERFKDACPRPDCPEKVG